MNVSSRTGGQAWEFQAREALLSSLAEHQSAASSKSYLHAAVIHAFAGALRKTGTEEFLSIFGLKGGGEIDVVALEVGAQSGSPSASDMPDKQVACILFGPEERFSKLDRYREKFGILAPGFIRTNENMGAAVGLRDSVGSFFKDVVATNLALFDIGRDVAAAGQNLRVRFKGESGGYEINYKIPFALIFSLGRIVRWDNIDEVVEDLWRNVVTQSFRHGQRK